MKYGRFFFSALGTLFVGGMIAAAVAQHSPHADLVRIHVVANSDSPQDQAMKLRVRDAVLESIDAHAIRADNARDYMVALADSLPVIRAAAQDALHDAGVDQPVEARVGIYRFPNRSYAGGTLPAGRYMALRVEIGKAAGQNWWCVMYPTMCLHGEGDVLSDDAECVQIRSWLWERLKAILGGNKA